MSRFLLQPGHAEGISGARRYFDTARPAIKFFPDDRNLVVPVTFSYPDLVKGDAYAFARGLIGTQLNAACSSYLTIDGQEWGPDLGYSLPDILLGYVPAHTDILDVQVSLTRTKAPTPFNGKSIPVLFKQGAWVNVPNGGGLPVEFLWPMSRMIEVVMGGTVDQDTPRPVYLRRRQSVTKRRYFHWRSGNDIQNSGWSYGGTAGPYGHIVALIESRGPVWDPSGDNYQRGRTYGCSLSDPTDFSSTYVGTIKVVPGHAGAAIAPPGATGPLLGYMGMQYSEADGSYQAFAGTPIGNPHSSRLVVVSVSAAYTNTNGSPAVTSVAVGGVAASILVQRLVGGTGLGYVAAIAAAWVPNGETATVEVSFATGMNQTAINVYSAYYLSTGAISSAGASDSSAASVGTLPGGFAIAAATERAVAPGLSGIENIYEEQMVRSSPSRYLWVSRGFQKTTGAALAVATPFNSPHVIASFA